MNVPKWNPGQEAAIEIDGRDLMVTAGAGTGKTTVLVARILRSLSERGFDLNDLLVVTFTDKAAREMKERIYTEIARTPALRHHLPQIPRAQISTIHAFCAGLLRENFLLAGVEPSFRVLDENGQIEALDEALRKTLHEWYLLDDEDGQRFRRLVELAGFNEKGEELREIVRRLYEYARSTPEFETYLDQILSQERSVSSQDQDGEPKIGLFSETTWAPAAVKLESLPWWTDFIRISEREWSAAVEIYQFLNAEAKRESYSVDEQMDLAEILGAFRPQAMADPKVVEAWQEALVAKGFLGSDGAFKLKYPRAPNGANGAIAGYKIGIDEAKKVFDVFVPQFLTFRAGEAIAEHSSQIEDLRILVSLVREMEGYYSAYKRQGGYLDYGDLEVKASHFVRRHGQDLGLESRYREVMIDEYQDTNHLQESILRGVSQPGRRFRVGDVKQSIYQFRLADPQIFLAAVRGSLPVRSLDELVEMDGRATLPSSARFAPSTSNEMADPPKMPAAVFLTENYRSHPEVLYFVNHLFGWLFDSTTIGSDYEQQALEPGLALPDSPAGLSDDPRVEINLVQLATKVEENRLLQRSIDHADLQPRWVARRVASLAEDSALKGEDGQTDWSGVAILLRSRVRATLFVEALRREGVPANLADGSTLFEEPLVRDLRSILQVVDNPRNDVALAAALRSPIYAITDGDLLRIRMAWPNAIGFLDGLVGAAFSHDPSSAVGRLLPKWPSGAKAFAHWVGTSHHENERLVGPKLRRRVRRALDDFQIWRDRESKLGLSEFLRELAEEVHLVARIAASGETTHPERVLDRFLSLASSFESERGPSLHGFLNRLDALESSGRLEGGSLEPNRRGVQVMTIHKSKGLEFPVVVVPQLEWRFSSKDRLASRIRIGPRWVGVRQFDEATYSRREANGRKVLEWIQEQEGREEEARVLYVALTRARDRLLLFAADRFNPDKAEDLPALLSERRKQTAFDRIRWFKEGLPWAERAECDPVELERQRLSPRTDLTWEELVERDRAKGGASLGVTDDAPKGPIDHAREWTLERPRMSIRWIPKARLVASLTSSSAEEESSLPVGGDVQQRNEIRAALESAFEPTSASIGDVGATGGPGKNLVLPPLPGATSSPQAAKTLGRVLLRTEVPPIACIDGLRGKYWVTEFKSADDHRRRVALEDDGTGFWGPFVPKTTTQELSVPREGVFGAAVPDTIEQDTAGIDPAAAGVRYHQALALLDLSQTSAEQLDSQFEEFSRTPWWDAHPRDRALEEGIVDFFVSDLGQQLSLAAAEDRVEREVSFSLKWSAADLRRYAPDLDLEPDPRWSAEEWQRELEQTWVLLQGRIDCVFGSGDGWRVIDWKTDRVEPEAVGERAKAYRSQMELYGEAISRLWGSPARVTVAFLRPGIQIPLEEID